MSLVEREELLGQLESLFDRASAGSGRLAFIGGEAGVGKTALARAFVERVPSRGRVLSGACDPLSAPRPLAPFRDMKPMAELVERHHGRHELLTAVLDELALLTVMVVEDVHWADEATVDVLRFVGRRIEGTRSLLLVTYRDEPDSEQPLRTLLGDLATAPGCVRLHVPPLSPAGVAALAAGHAYEPDRLHRITGGNPFYVTEVLAAPGWTVPETVADAVLARVARLSPPTRELLELVSLAPGGLELTVAETLVADASAAIDEGIASGVLTLTDGFVAFRHELARLALEGDVLPAARRALHARLLGLLAGLSTVDPARLAHHAEAAGDGAAVLEFAPLAAERAAALGATREAAAQYGRALRFSDGVSPAALAELLQARSYACYVTGEFDEAIGAQERAVALRRTLGDSRATGDALRSLSRVLRFIGRTSEAEDAAREALVLLETLGPSRELALAYNNLSHIYVTADDTDGALRWGNAGLELAEQLHDTEARVYALINLGAAELLASDGASAGTLERSLELALVGDLEELAGRAYLNLVWWPVRQRSYPLAHSYLEEGLEYCSARGLDLWTLFLVACRARMELDAGRLVDAGELALEVVNDLRTWPVPRLYALSVVGLVRARQGLPGVWAPLDEALELAEPTGELQRIGPVACARAEAAWLDGRSEQVVRETAAALDLALRRREAWISGDLACWRMRAGLREPLPPRCAAPFALQLRGDWAGAAQLWASIGCPYEAALAMADADGVDEIRRGFDELQRLGALRAASIAARRLREHGARGLPRGPHSSTRRNPGQLTARQLDVLALVAAGLSNGQIAERLFITEKTAAHHVSAILRKLGVRSRGEAAAVARKMGIATPEAG